MIKRIFIISLVLVMLLLNFVAFAANGNSNNSSGSNENNAENSISTQLQKILEQTKQNFKSQFPVGANNSNSSSTIPNTGNATTKTN